MMASVVPSLVVPRASPRSSGQARDSMAALRTKVGAVGARGRHPSSPLSSGGREGEAVSEPDAGAGEFRRRRPPPEWVEETGDSVFSRPTNPGTGAYHDGRTEPDRNAWDQRTRVDGYGAPGAWDHPTHPDRYAERTRVQPGYPGPAGSQPTPRYGGAPAGYADRADDRGPYPGQDWAGAPPGAPPGGPMQRKGPRPQPADRWDEPGGRRGAGRDDRDRDRSDGDRPKLGFPFGLGTVVGLAGLAAVLLSLMSLPWFTVAGEGAGLKDIRTAFDLPETDPGDVVPGAGEGTGATVPSSIPTPGEVSDAVQQEVRNVAGETVASMVDTGKGRYLELYAETLWMAVAGACAFAVLFATVLSPKSFALSLILGFRRLSGVLVVLAGIAHGVALWVVFSGDGPSPDTGVWVGVGGLVAVLVATILGPKR
jgi:hypothetical protein